MEKDELLKIFREHKVLPTDKTHTSKGEAFKYDYTIFPLADINAFYKHCIALQQHIDGLEFVGGTEDVDGTLINEYRLNGLELRVYYDTNIDAVYTLSEFDIKPYGFGD